MKIVAIIFFVLASLLTLPLAIDIIGGIVLFRFDVVMMAVVLLLIPTLLFIAGLICWKKAKQAHSLRSNTKSMS